MPEFSNQNLMQNGQRVHELWLDVHTNKQTEITTLNTYRYIVLTFYNVQCMNTIYMDRLIDFLIIYKFVTHEVSS